MYRKAVNYLRGQAVAEVVCTAPERVVNLCAAHGIPFWDLTWLTETSFRVTTTLSGARRLAEVTADIGAQVTVCRKSGAPELWRRCRHRYVLLAAALVLPLLLAVGSAFIWDFEVTGNDTVPTETILRALEDYGITVGSPGLHIDQETMRNHVLLALPEVSWLAVNVRGCVAHVQVVERHRPPKAADRSTVTNIVARRAGLITKVEALEGQAMVLPGATVTEGQLLISGVSETEHIGARFVHSMGAVWARTWYELSVSVPLQITQPAAGSRSHSRWALDIGKHRIKFYGKGSITGVDCDKITYYKPFTLPGGLRLPLTLVRERITAWEGAAAERTEQSARQEGEQQLLALLSARLPEGSTVTDTRFAAVRQGDRLTVVLKAECLEQIGQTVTLPETETTQR